MQFKENEYLNLKYWVDREVGHASASMRKTLSKDLHVPKTRPNKKRTSKKDKSGYREQAKISLSAQRKILKLEGRIRELTTLSLKLGDTEDLRRSELRYLINLIDLIFTFDQWRHNKLSPGERVSLRELSELVFRVLENEQRKL